MLLLALLQEQVGLRQLGLQQLLLQVSVLEDLFQVLEDTQPKLLAVFTLLLAEPLDLTDVRPEGDVQPIHRYVGVRVVCSVSAGSSPPPAGRTA